MMQPPPLPRCDCCGLQISAQQADSCPRCKYPTDVSKEEHFLASSIADLQHVEVNGGGAFPIPVLLKLYQSVTSVLPDLQRIALYGSDDLTVTELLHRQQARLEQLHQLQTVEMGSEEDTQPEIRGIHALPTKRLPTSFAQVPMDGEKTIDMEPGRLVSQLAVPKRAKKPSVPQTARFVKTLAQSTGSVQSKAQNTVASTHVPIPKPRNAARADAFRSFFIGSPISLMVLLGAFLILMAMLTFVLSPTDPTHHPSPLFAFLVVLGTQIFFGAASIGTQRFSKFINVARIYTFVSMFALFS
jgi:hypothetical protein